MRKSDSKVLSIFVTKRLQQVVWDKSKKSAEIRSEVQKVASQNTNIPESNNAEKGKLEK